MPSEKLRVLIVDDNADGVDALGDVLETYGYQVLRAYSGREALALAATDLPDLAIIDVNMPAIDGIETARRLASLADPHSIRMIAYTGSAAAPVSPAAPEQPFEVVVSKGAPIDLLIRVIRSGPTLFERDVGRI